MYLNHCPQDTYFEITELWFEYKDRMYYMDRGIEEGEIVYILENSEENITLSTKSPQTNESINITFTKEEAFQICGEPIQKKPKTKRITKR